MKTLNLFTTTNHRAVILSITPTLFVQDFTLTFPLHIFRYEEVMNSAGEQGVRQTYSQLHQLMQDYPDVQEMLLDLLTGTIPFLNY